MKHCFALILLVLPVVVFSQPLKNTFSVGGAITYNRDRTPYTVISPLAEGVSHYLQLSPTVGYFFVNRLSVGAYVPFSWSKAEISGTRDDYYSKGRSIGFGPFVKYYQPIVPDFYATARASYNWGTTRTESTIAGPVQKDKSKTQYSNLSLGVAYFLNSHVSAEFQASVTKYTKGDNIPQDDKYTDHITLSVGLQVFLHKQTE